MIEETTLGVKDVTLKQLINSRPDLVLAIRAGEDESAITTHIEKDAQSRTRRWTEEQRDLDGALIGKRVDEYSYYETGEVDIILLRVYDGEGGLVSEKKVKHFVDGRRAVGQTFLSATK